MLKWAMKLEFVHEPGSNRPMKSNEVRPFEANLRLDVRVIGDAFHPLTPIEHAVCDCIANQWTK